MNLSGNRHRLLDVTAVCLSAACLVHCLATPLLLAILPVLGAGLAGDERVHQVLLAIALPVSFTALLYGCRRHRRFVLVAVGFSGLALMGLALTEAAHVYERVLTVTGVLLVAAAHSVNWHLSRRLFRPVSGQ